MTAPAASFDPPYQQWLNEGLRVEAVKTALQTLGCEEPALSAALAEYRKLRAARRQTAGFIWMIAGAFLGFASCVLSMYNPFPALYGWVLYGCTSLAVVLIFVGFYLVFED